MVELIWLNHVGHSVRNAAEARRVRAPVRARTPRHGRQQLAASRASRMARGSGAAEVAAEALNCPDPEM